MKKLLFLWGMMVLSASMVAQSILPAGHPSRDKDLDVLPGFQNPPSGYGEVPFYWWLGDTLTREHLTGHLDLLKNKGISSLQVNCAHSDKGGKLWGLTFKSKPEIFTEEWWDLFGWFMREAKKRGMTVSLSDYTLGVGQEQYVDEILADYPEISGSELRFMKKRVSGSLHWELPEKPLSVQAYRFEKDSSLIASSVINLESSCSGKSLNWKSPAGEWLVTVVYASPKSLSYNPMHPLSGKKYVEYFFQRFEDRFPEDSKGGLNFFFSDELNFQLGNLIWDDYFQSEFKKRKGYDIVPYLSALFVDMGEKTAKYRLDYNDVMVSLSEEHFFEPVYRWHEDRGLIYGCDHGGRGLDVAEFGDYFRTQRWNQGPGCDQPKLSKHIIKNKVASSIAHMYNRPRVWLEGFHSSGWDTSSGKLLDAIFANFVQGQNLLSLHGLYYSTPGGWWEWAPPCNHFRMPYWAEMDKLLACSERLSYLLSQGYHCADVAMLYPVEPVVAGNGRASVDCAFKLGEELYHQGIDFDFMDYESLARAEIKGSELQVAGESFRVLIVPEMETMRSTSIEKAVAFQKAGGTVIWVNRLPNATEQGEADETMLRLVAEQIVTPASLVLSEVNQATKRDFAIVEGKIDEPNVMHRKVGHRDLYAVYHVDKGTKCYFRSLGGAELWNPWTGEVQPLSVCQTDEEGSYIRIPLEKTEMQLIVFDPNKPAKIEDVHPVVPTTAYPISGRWETELIPVLDNRWGDYHWPATPALIGAEIRKMDYATQVTDNWNTALWETRGWTEQSVGFGDYMVCLEALSQPIDETYLLQNTSRFPWKPYAFSWRWGVENDYGHQGYHGLKTEMYADFIRLGSIKDEFTQLKRVDDPRGKHYYLLTDVVAPQAGMYEVVCDTILPMDVWINGKKIPIRKNGERISLQSGKNRMILHYQGACTTYFLLRDPDKKGQMVKETLAERPLSMPWNGDLSLLPFISPSHSSKQYYRFVSAPGLQSLSFSAYTSQLKVWINGEPAQVKEGTTRKDGLTSFEVKGKAGKSPALITMEVESSYPGGAVFPYPIQQHCGKGEIELGDWSRLSGLNCYSGGMWYRKEIELTKEECERALTLDLGDVVSTAELFVNGKSVGLRMAAPWKFDLYGVLKPGKNLFEIRVYNTVATHYLSIPTMYRGEVTSGILGTPQLLMK